jgi:beta-N-acetylhexosaminidase
VSQYGNGIYLTGKFPVNFWLDRVLAVSWVPAGSLRRISTGAPPGGRARSIAALLAEAAGRSLVIVVRDAHRHPAAADAASQILAARPDAAVVEMGLPVWRPRAALYLATFGASRTSSRAAAEILARP